MYQIKTVILLNQVSGSARKSNRV